MRQEHGKKHRTVFINTATGRYDVELRIKTDGIFCAEINGRWLEAKTQSELIERARVELEQTSSFDYHREILIEYRRITSQWHHEVDNDEQIRGFTFDWEVWEVSDKRIKSADGEAYLVRELDLHHDGTIVEPRPALPTKPGTAVISHGAHKPWIRNREWNPGKEDKIRLPYTKERYTRLMDLRKRIIELVNKLDGFLGEEDILSLVLDGKKPLFALSDGGK